MSLDVARLTDGAESRVELWTRLIQEAGVRTVAEIGVYRGRFAAALLDACPQLETYYMIDPWRNLADWNKPANTSDDRFEAFHREAMERTEAHAAKRVVLRGTTTEVIDGIPDGSLDLAYVDGDHTLRGITIDLVRAWPKVRDGGWIGGDDFCPSIWQHDEAYEPTLVFPLAVHFAEAAGALLVDLPDGGSWMLKICRVMLADVGVERPQIVHHGPL
jgi:predicted O-methyltransferase YrrM